MLNKIKWYLKQIFPLTYTSKYKTGLITKICIWKMWLGACYDIREYEVK
jgi:hypothetical protein